MTSFRGKKGAVPDTMVLDVIVFLICALVFSMVIFFGWKIFSDMKTDVRADFTLNESKTVIDEVENRYPSVFDAILIFILLGMWAAAFVAALNADQHPVIFGFMMFIMIFVLIVGAIFANYFEETFQDDELSSISASFPMTFWAMTHLLMITIGVVVTVMLGLMGKNRVL